MIAGLYARVSTSRQEDQETIESQVVEIKARIEADGNMLAAENVFVDDGWTGEMLQRPGLDLMRDAAVDGKFEALYVYDRGRLSRVFAYQEIIIEELIDKGVKFVTLHDVQAQTPEERVLQAMQGVFHEYERVKIAERMRRGKLYKARNGILINGQAPYGYTYIPKQGNESAKIEINENEVDVVRKVFHWVGIERISIREVKRRLKDLGIRPKKGKREIWTSGPICRLLRNRVYEDGVVYYNKTEAIVAKKPLKPVKYKKIKRTSRRVRAREDWIPYQVPKILEDSWLFEKVQQILSFNRSFAGKQRKYDYLLSGLVYCECGSKRVGDGCNANGHYYYRCAEKLYKFPLEGNCKAHGVNAMVLDGLTWLNLKKFLGDKETLRQQAEKWLGQQAAQDGVLQAGQIKLRKLLDDLKQEEMRYAKAYGTGTLDFEQFQELTKEQRRKKQSYELQVKELGTKVTEAAVIKPEETDRLCKAAELVLAEIAWDDKKKIIRDIVDKITIYEGGEVELRGHLPLFDQKLGYEPIGRDSRISKCWQEYAV
ncbi:MAG: Uncharacterized protein G01um101416_1067 [Microgenomates group bacterium Gr01-1014_16]|nr:MAG: Uncharacterized protein G01um101416_1067 [Microgenomates group bacterium Gr01-1014_16]